ncbi:hypothetical protein MMC11_000823 [Xylographa trunciseda]|nr:hypothetical protein [Xylographa trunciseda]
MSPADDRSAEDAVLAEREQWQDDGPEPSTADSSDLQIRSSASSDMERGRISLPVWMRESSRSFHWKWVPLPIRHLARSAAAWSKGPDPPQIQKITPLFPFVQEMPLRLVEILLPGKIHKAWALITFYAAWLLIFVLVLHHSASSGEIEGYGQPARIWCGANFWSKGNGCELNGNECRPFENAVFPFSCPANCMSVEVLNPYAVGDQEIVYHPLVIGGPEDGSQVLSFERSIYRADSFICQAAIHAGVISNTQGGCGVVSMTGKRSSFPSALEHGIQSFEFDSTFPKSFTFIPGISSECGSSDPRWPLLGVTVAFTSLLSIFCGSAAIFFPSVFVMLFFHVGLVSDPPNISDYPSLTSLIVERFLPAAFVAYVIYRFCVKPQLTGLTAQFEKTILWLGGAWVGSLNNYTFDKLPIQRLTPHDIKAQPGAIPALCVIVISIFLIALGQIWYLRLEGRFRRYLAVYAIMAAFLLICVAIPWLNLRIHHYILALLLLPGTRMQTRPSLLYQGLLIGLFISGVARWGFDSILQTSAALLGDGQNNSLLPNMTEPLAGVANITFGWSLPPSPYDGVSVLVNDVERYRWYYGEGEPSFTWSRLQGEEQGKEYFRFGHMIGSASGDYSKAGVWTAEGSWIPMQPGPSR